MAVMNGWITIGTKMDSKQLEKDIAKTKKELEKYSEEAEKLTSKKATIQFEIDLKEEELKRKIKEVQEKAKIDVEAISGGTPYTRDLKAQKINELAQLKINQLNAQYNKYIEEADNKLENINAKLNKNEKSQKNANERLIEQNNLLDRAKLQENTKEIYDNIKNGAEGANKGLRNVIKSITKWGLALIGIRGLYGMIRNSISTITSEDKQLATDIEYMKWVIAQTLKPVVEWLVSALYTILGLINTITKALFNYNIFTGKSAKDFKTMKVNSGGVAKNMKDANKQLAGFDEMNVLQDNTSSSDGGGGGVGGDITDWEMPNMDEYEKKVEKIKNAWLDFGNELKYAVENIPITKWFDAFGNWGLAMYGLTLTVQGLWEIIEGLFEFVKGIVEIIVGLITGDTKKIKQGIYDLADGIWKIIDGLIRTIVGLILSLVGVILGLILEMADAIAVIVKGLWDGLVYICTAIGNWIGDRISDFINWILSKINDLLNFFKSIPSKIKEWFSSMVNWFANLFSKIVNLFSNFGTNVGNAVGGAFKGVINKVIGAVEGILNNPIKAINGLIKTVNKISPVKIGTLSTFSLPRLAKGGIINQPGRGVAIGGESGREGVIPLTDSQQMAMLGEAIGKYIKINANIVNTMNGRVISRELKTIQNENDFAFNR